MKMSRLKAVASLLVATGLFLFASCSDGGTDTEYLPLPVGGGGGTAKQMQTPPDREKFVVVASQMVEGTEQDLKKGSITIKEDNIEGLEYFCESENDYVLVEGIQDFDAVNQTMQKLSAGTYSFRFAKTQNEEASYPTNVTVQKEYVPAAPTVTPTMPQKDTTKEDQEKPKESSFSSKPATKGESVPSGIITIGTDVSLQRLEYAKATAQTATLSWTSVTQRQIVGLEGAYYYFRYKADETHNASDYITVIVTEEEAVQSKKDQTAPDSAKFAVTQETYTGAKDGKIVIAQDLSIENLAYKTQSSDWTAVPASRTLESLSNGSYSFKYQGNDEYNESAVTVVQVALKPVETEDGDADRGDGDVETQQEVAPSKEGLTAFSNLNISDMSTTTFQKDTIANNVKIVASSTATIAIDANKKTVSGVNYTKRLKLGGEGSATARNVTIYVGSNVKGTLKVVAISSSGTGTGRKLKANDTELGEAPTSAPSTLSATVQADADGYIAIYGTGGINIYQITFDTGSSSSSSGSGGSAGGAGGATSGDKSNLSDVQTPTLDNTGLAPSYTGDNLKVGKRSKLNEIVKDVSKIRYAIYVSPDGKASNEGTSASPLDIQTAITRVQGGGAVVLKSGTYKLGKTLNIAYGNCGTRTAMKYMLPDSTSGAVLDFSPQLTADTSRGVQLDGDYWHIYGITCYNAGDNGMCVTGNNNIIERCIFQANQDTGLQIARRASTLSNKADWPHDNLILNCTSFDNKDDKTGENADGFASKLTCGEGNVFDGCISYANCDDGWDLYAKPATGPIGVVTIQNCVALQNGKTTTGANYANGDMNGFKLGGSNNACPTAHKVKNCLSFLNGKDGFTDNGNGGALNVSNCTSYGNVGSNFNFYRTYKGVFSSLMTATGKGTDKFGTKDTPSTIEKSLYCNGGKYYFQEAKSSVTNGQKIGKVVSNPYPSEFVSSTPPEMDLRLDGKCRNKDGTINMAGFLEVKKTSDYAGMGAKFGTEASEILDVYLFTN